MTDAEARIIALLEQVVSLLGASEHAEPELPPARLYPPRPKRGTKRAV